MSRTAATCHPDRDTHGHGLCRACYMRERYAKNPELRERDVERNRQHRADPAVRAKHNEAARVRARERYRSDPEYRTRVIELGRASVERNRERVLARKRAYNAAHRERDAAVKKAWYERNREALGHAPFKQRPAATCHPDRVHYGRGLCEKCFHRDLYETKYRVALGHAPRKPADPVAARAAKVARAHKRRARLRDARSPGVSAREWREILETFGHACTYCLRRDTKLTRDHVIAIARGGLDEASNVVPACMACNTRKAHRTLLWCASKGMAA